MKRKSIQRLVPRCCHDTAPYCYRYPKTEPIKKRPAAACDKTPCAPDADEAASYAQDTSTWD